MRLPLAHTSDFVAVFASGLVIGWSALAAADPTPPPTAPIFYCPAGSQGTSVATKPPPAKTPVAKTPAHLGKGCPRPGLRHVSGPVARHRLHAVVRVARVDTGVSASQAFIYRYERAQHGLNAEAAEEAWDHRGCPRCATHDDADRDAHHDGGRREEADRDQHLRDAQVDGHGMSEHRTDGDHQMADGGHADAWRRDETHRTGDQQAASEGRQRRVEIIVQRQEGGESSRSGGSMHRDDGAVRRESGLREWADGSEHRGGVVYEREASRSGGWSYSEQDGRSHSERWGDEDGRHVDHRRDSHGYVVAGRDSHGYLTWPGKTPEQDR